MSGEANQVLWRGVRPISGIRGIWPDIDAVRVHASKFVSGVGVNIVYTVPAGKKLFISNALQSSLLTIDIQAFASLQVRNAADVQQYFISCHYFIVTGAYNTTFNFSLALEADAGWDVYVESNHANLATRGTIHGWLENA
ncbi:MAG: hypothetical protein WAV28_18775 [Sedimentisphaerales bacterium]